MILWWTSSFYSPKNWAETLFKVYVQSLCSLIMISSISNWTHPSMLISFMFQCPSAFELKHQSRILDNECFSLENPLYLSIDNAWALSKIYGKSNPKILYPVIMSGSVFLMNSLHSVSNLVSLSYWNTSVPTIGAQVPNVKMFLAYG